MGVDMSNPSAAIDLFRAPEDVFSQETLTSAEGKCITDGHPDGFVTPDNFNEFSRGHIQNVRKGPEALDSGDWPMIADLLIMAEPLLGKVKNRICRELSLGYDYAVKKVGDQIYQIDMIINHCAVVPKGRAGPEARIMDAMPAVEEAALDAKSLLSTPIAPLALKGVATSSTSTAPLTKKESKPVPNILKHLLGLGFKAYAADAEPEQVAEAAEAIKDAAEVPTTEPEQQTLDARRKAKDRRAKDADPEDKVTEVTETQDAARRRKAHDDLDAMLDGKAKAGDADIKALKRVLDDFLGEEDEPEVTEDADPAELEELLGAGEDPDAEDEELCKCGDPECPGGCAMDVEADPGEELEPSGEEALVEDRHAANDAVYSVVGSGRGSTARNAGAARTAAHGDAGRATDAVKATLRMLRPFVARANDQGMTNAFNSALAAATKSSKASSGGYGEFAGAAARRASNLPRNPNPMARANDAKDREATLQKYYDDRRKGGK
jgi:hypothetical protein